MMVGPGNFSPQFSVATSGFNFKLKFIKNKMKRPTRTKIIATIIIILYLGIVVVLFEVFTGSTRAFKVPLH